MYVSYEHKRIVHQQMLKETLQQQQRRPERPRKSPKEKRKGRMMHALAVLLVKLGRTLERIGQTYLRDEQRNA